MSKRRKAGAANRVMAYIAAAVVHLLLIGALFFNFTKDDDHEIVEAFDAEKIDTIKASVIDESQIKDQREKLKKKLSLNVSVRNKNRKSVSKKSWIKLRNKPMKRRRELKT